jgi:tetratricopeptide (TPR) repeat protein
LALCRRLRHREAEAATLDSLGYIAQHTGDSTSSVQYYEQAVDLFRVLCNRYEEASALEHLGRAYLDQGKGTDARVAWQLARELFESQGRMAQVRHLEERLAMLGASPDPDLAQRQHDIG